ncbi:MAG TPA: AAA family ATPase [Opitutaceae bacterium]|jgi:ATP-dependent Clp protease ATP-binding subunit ClpB|nr:AAA family ATPase [Opitutaceae bacterium]
MAVLRGLRDHLRSAVLGQDEALGGLCDALLAGEMGHTPPGRPRSLALLLGPTGTGKTKAVLSASEHLFGTNCVARINCAEFSSAERVPLLLGSRAGDPGLLGLSISRMREAGGRIVLLDEIEKAHPSVADHLLGIEEAAVTLASGETLDLSGLHIIATSNVGSAGVTGMEGVSRSSVRRFVEQEASAQFRPEVLARFTAILVFGHLSRDVQVRICEQMLAEEVVFQARALTRSLGHAHDIGIEADVPRRLVSEGWHRRLGARPMRNAVERRVRGALVDSQLRGALGPGVTRSALAVDPAGAVRLAIRRAAVTL